MVWRTKCVMLLVFGAAAPAAHAYLDPSTGSMIISAVVGVIASVVLALKTYWYRLKSLFHRGQETPGREGPES